MRFPFSCKTNIAVLSLLLCAVLLATPPSLGMAKGPATKNATAKPVVTGQTTPAQSQVQASKPSQPLAETGKTALILATFGTTKPQATDPLAGIRAEISKRNPNLPIFTAYTSNHVVRTARAANPEQTHIMTLPEALAKVSALGYKNTVVQSLHVVSGKEFDILTDITGRFSRLPKGLENVRTGLPLIGNNDDAQKLANILATSLPAARTASDAVIFVGHGAEGHAGTLAYPALQCFLQERDPLLFVGTIEGKLHVDTLAKSLRAKGVSKVWLVPLLTVVGEHATVDIFGDGQSWQHTLINAGLTVEPVRQGLLHNSGAVSLWADHVDDALKSLATEAK